MVPPVAKVQPVVFTSVNLAMVAPVPVPLTSKGAEGVVVPIPTLPLERIAILLAKVLELEAPYALIGTAIIAHCWVDMVQDIVTEVAPASVLEAPLALASTSE